MEKEIKTNAKKFVQKYYPMAYSRKKGHSWYIVPAGDMRIDIGRGETDSEAWERAADFCLHEQIVRKEK